MADDKPHLRMAARVATDGLNLHYMPGGERLLDALPRGMKVTVLRYEQRPQYLWAYVRVPERFESGWCRADFLTFDPPPAAAQVEPPRKPTELPQIDVKDAIPEAAPPLSAWAMLAAAAVAVALSLVGCSLS